jgi:hypothetical protein
MARSSVSPTGSARNFVNGADGITPAQWVRATLHPDTIMRSLLLLPLLALSAAAPAASQAILVPLRCTGGCPAPGRLPRAVPSDTTSLSAVLSRGEAKTAVHLAFRNDTDGVIDGALFLPLPADAIVSSVAVNPLGGTTTQYGDWSRDEESRWVLEGILRDRPSAGLRAYRGARVLHAPILDIPARTVMQVTVHYHQPLREADGSVAYSYPLSVGEDAPPLGPFKALVIVETEAGFRALSSPSHELEVRWGWELVRCPCGSRCGRRGAESHRIKHVRASGYGGERRKAFELVYTLIPPGSPDAVSPPPDPVC